MKSKAHLKYEELLYELHLLDKHGLGDSVEADKVRDQMDAPWYEMTDEEQAEVEKLAKKLFEVEDDVVMN